jgi:hypothetical protein
MALNSKGQVIPAAHRAEHNVHESDHVESMQVDGTSRIVCADDASTRGQRLVQRLRGTADSEDVEGMSTDEIIDLLRGE